MRLGLLFLTAALAAALGSASAQTSIPPGNPVPGAATSLSTSINDDTTICKYEHMTGSLIVTQVCRTQRAWKLMESDAKEFMEFGFRGSHQCDGVICNKPAGG
jgi:hypothetical protein